MLIKCFFFLLLLFSVTMLTAQDYLGDDLPFFQKKAALYESWLEQKGMGVALKVDKVRLQKNDLELELFLSLKTIDPDSAIALWTGVVERFKQDNPELRLHEVLYQTFVRMMEIPADQGNIQIYFPDQTTAGYNACFYVWIYEEDGNILEESRINNCKSQTLNIPISLPKVKLVNEQSELRFRGKEEAKEVFDAVILYARKRYEVTQCYDRAPRVEEIEQSDYSLTFVVNDLCREVLADETKSTWCYFVERWWGPCNDMRRERLEFTFNYIPTSEGYVLSGFLTGKFGSGVYKPRISGYMDMEPDFEADFLIPYVRSFQRDLRSYLEQ